MTLGEIIKKFRTEHSLSMEDFSKRSGISRAYISLLERNEHPKTKKPIAPSLKSIKQAAQGMNMNLNDLFHMLNDDGSLESAQSSATVRGVPIDVLGRVTAGIPIEAITDIIDTEEITEELASTGTFFGLKIKGDSMEPRICNGDVVIVRQQNDADSGDIVIAGINGTEATCKRLRKYRDGIEFISNNPSYKPMFFTKKEIQTLPVQIIGKVIELRGKF